VSVGTPEVILCLLIALLVLGPDKLPTAARQLGRALAEFKRISSDVQGQVHDFINDDFTADGPEERKEKPADGSGAPSSPPPDTQGFRLIEDQPAKPSPEVGRHLAAPKSAPADDNEPLTPWRAYEPAKHEQPRVKDDDEQHG
jgi:TatA/E family protein of Tat protein translocase